MWDSEVGSIIPYGSRHCLRRYLTPQIIPQSHSLRNYGWIHRDSQVEKNQGSVYPLRRYQCSAPQGEAPEALTFLPYSSKRLQQHQQKPDSARKQLEKDRKNYKMIEHVEKTSKGQNFPGFGEFLDASECKDTIMYYVTIVLFLSPLTPS